MKYVALALVLAVATLTLADIIRARGLRQWRDGRSQDGMASIRLAERINPISLDLKLDQIESLFTGYRMTKNAEYLKETGLLARDLTRLYPGNVQAQSVYAMSLVYIATHGGDYYPLAEALLSVKMDPLSVDALESAMFLISSKRVDYSIFKELGVARSRLTRQSVVMRCTLCGHPWLEHK